MYKGKKIHTKNFSNTVEHFLLQGSQQISLKCSLQICVIWGNMLIFFIPFLAES